MLAHTGVDHAVTAVLAAAAVAAYGWVWLRQRQPDRRRLAAWVGGVLTVLASTLPPMERMAERSFTGHMVQHLLVILIGAPLLVLAAPLRSLERAGRGPLQRLGGRLGPPARRSLPFAGPVLLVGALYVTHLTGVYDLALRVRWVHEVQHAAYLGGGVLTWAGVLGRGRDGALGRIAAALGVSAAGAFLGVILLTAPEPLVATYRDHLGAVAAVADQRRAASLMWVSGMLMTVPLLVVSVWRWATLEERLTRRAEAISDRRAADGSGGSR